ncbi:hypothetical protein B0H15DRAFT_882672 [Mycena belliarum]|uniref:Uncharacterized protein n=1 Tax=Mycena belliarum TaxID=1033014 RepID=A0AAD6U6F6_9AGAR|nr:hypothetical protein B0H15DRAFT_882672 [Mycena belliae]
MSFLQRILWPFSRRELVAPPPGVDTVPCTGLDLIPLDVVLTSGFIVNTRLDAKKLEETLSTLIVHRLPRAGARLALRNGVYEFQVPKIFDAETPPVVFTVEDYAEPYRCATRPELPIHLPDSFNATQPFVRPEPNLEVYFRSKDCPATLEAFLVPNMPSLHVHVAVFDDLTFIGVTASHVCADALGTQTLLHAWTRLLNGEALDSIPGMARDAAPFAAFRGPTTVAHPRGWYDLGWFSIFLFIVRLVIRVLRDPKEALYIIRVPKTFLDDSKRDIMHQLKLQGSSEWVGSSDVLLAWWFKTAYGRRKVTDTTPIHIHIPVNLRGKPVFSNAEVLPTPYLHNAFLGIAVAIPAHALRTESLGALALRLRRAINDYTSDPARMAADLHWRCAHPLKVLFPCPPHAEFFVQTSWRAAHYGALDFSGAAVEANTKARVVFCTGFSSSRMKIPYRGFGVILMEDEDAVWMSQTRGANDWEDIRRSGVVAFS